MRYPHLLALGALLIASLLGPLASRAQPAEATESRIHLRRASFDPLASQPAALAEARLSDSTLLLAQLAGPPDEAELAALRTAGLEPLIYIPDNTFLVRANANSTPQSANLRWIGALPPAYKLDASIAIGDSSTPLDLQVVATPDADLHTLAATISAAGGSILGSFTGLTETSLSVKIPPAALVGLALRDDIVWIEPFQIPQLLNDQSRGLMGVTTVRQELSWLTGSGQIVAVTDTGLDVSSQVSADFSGRIVAAFTPKQMKSSCTTTSWSDQYGHGTHVSGSILGSGALSPSGSSFAGVAPDALLVVENIKNSASPLEGLSCLAYNDSFLQKAYDAGARVQNVSWGFTDNLGSYTSFTAIIDDFLYRYPQHLLVVSAGNSGVDNNSNGVIDADSINPPASAKNVLAVGASENDRPPSATSCDQNNILARCWESYVLSIAPLSSDFISGDPGGMAASSSRGPADDGRIKPDLVAPGTNVISTRSHDSSAYYSDAYDSNYAYESGTSMAAPMVSGSAALVRQWLNQARGLSTPSAALVRALLLNGTTDLSPGQYGTGTTREIPAAWPNNVEGWGRVNVADSVELFGANILIRDDTSGLSSAGVTEESFTIAEEGRHLRVSLSWTDYPGSAMTSKALVNDLDLEVITPDGSVILGNAAADLKAGCRSGGADRCNTNESVDIKVAGAGTYTLRVRGASVAYGPQRFALVAGVAANPELIYFPLIAR